MRGFKRSLHEVRRERGVEPYEILSVPSSRATNLQRVDAERCGTAAHSAASSDRHRAMYFSVRRAIRNSVMLSPAAPRNAYGGPVGWLETNRCRYCRRRRACCRCNGDAGLRAGFSALRRPRCGVDRSERHTSFTVGSQMFAAASLCRTLGQQKVQSTNDTDLQSQLSSPDAVETAPPSLSAACLVACTKATKDRRGAVACDHNALRPGEKQGVEKVEASGD